MHLYPGSHLHGISYKRNKNMCEHKVAKVMLSLVIKKVPTELNFTMYLLQTQQMLNKRLQ